MKARRDHSCLSAGCMCVSFVSFTPFELSVYRLKCSEISVCICLSALPPHDEQRECRLFHSGAHGLTLCPDRRESCLFASHACAKSMNVCLRVELSRDLRAAANYAEHVITYFVTRKGSSEGNSFSFVRALSSCPVGHSARTGRSASIVPVGFCARGRRSANNRPNNGSICSLLVGDDVS